MSEFEKTCTYCKAKIKLSDNKGGKWLPYNLDGSSHDCRNKETKQETTTQNNDEAKLAAIIKTVQSVVKELEALKNKGVKKSHIVFHVENGLKDSINVHNVGESTNESTIQSLDNGLGQFSLVVLHVWSTVSEGVKKGQAH